MPRKQAVTITCPKCGADGKLMVKPDGQVLVTHYQNKQVIRHYINGEMGKEIILKYIKEVGAVNLQ